MIKKKTALITGITGQDGSYLAELLLSKGYIVQGIIRRASTFNTERIDHILLDIHNPKAKMFLHYGDLSDSGQLSNLIYNTKPDEIYHLGAQSHVRVSFDIPEYTGNVTGLSTTRILEVLRKSKRKTKFYQASSSEMFGSSPPPQSETTPFQPQSPYAIAKAYAYYMTVNYRDAYNIFACNGILFNHESPRRGKTFLTKKVTNAIANILAKKQEKLYLGNMDAKRDWGFAPEYAEFMWKMMQQEKPEDFVIGTGETHSVKEFVEKAFEYAGIDYDKYLIIDEKYFRPTEVKVLKADTSKSKKILDWKFKIGFDDLIKIMVDADMRAVGLEPVGEGDEILAKKFPERWWKTD
ncbi:MAG: GDP-mannose 4,6-dehydratase [archaeon]|nr:GDP-mannose 4,6-dehydratase [archaeon]